MELQSLFDDFQSRGVEIVAVSSNSLEVASKSKEEWGLTRFPLGYGLSMEDARQWGLFMSKGIKETEPSQFVEPAMFLIRPDQTLYASVIQSMPFARPPAAPLLSTLDFIIEKDYPARGEAS